MKQMKSLAEVIRETIDEHIRRRYNQEERQRIIARAQRKGRQTYKMKPAQAQVFRRIKASGGAITQMQYLAEDWRVTNPMFSRGWLLWRKLSGSPHVVIGERAPALELKSEPRRNS